jgi:hypothetical protein
LELSSSLELKGNLVNEDNLHTESERGIMEVISIVNQKGGVGKDYYSGKVVIRYYSIANKFGFG